MVRQRVFRAGSFGLAPGGHTAGRITLKVRPRPSSLSIRNRPRCRFTICVTMASPAPLLARPVAVDAAEPPGQARQVTLADPRALIRPADPDGRPAQQQVPRLAGHPEDHRHPRPLPRPLTTIATAFQRAPDIVARVAGIVLTGGGCFKGGNITPPPGSTAAPTLGRRRSPSAPACPLS